MYVNERSRSAVQMTSATFSASRRYCSSLCRSFSCASTCCEMSWIVVRSTSWSPSRIRSADQSAGDTLPSRVRK